MRAYNMGRENAPRLQREGKPQWSATGRDAQGSPLSRVREHAARKRLAWAPPLRRRLHRCACVRRASPRAAPYCTPGGEEVSAAGATTRPVRKVIVRSMVLGACPPDMLVRCPGRAFCGTRPLCACALQNLCCSITPKSMGSPRLMGAERELDPARQQPATRHGMS